MGEREAGVGCTTPRAGFQGRQTHGEGHRCGWARCGPLVRVVLAQRQCSSRAGQRIGARARHSAIHLPRRACASAAPQRSRWAVAQRGAMNRVKDPFGDLFTDHRTQPMKKAGESPARALRARCGLPALQAAFSGALTPAHLAACWSPRPSPPRARSTFKVRVGGRGLAHRVRVPRLCLRCRAAWRSPAGAAGLCVARGDCALHQELTPRHARRQGGVPVDARPG